MLLVVDINPHLERRLSGGDFPKGKVSQAEHLEIGAKGIGADLARLGVGLNEDTALMVFLGGSNGEFYASKFVSSNIRLFVEKLRDESQEAICLEEKYKETKIFTREPRLTREDIRDFYQLFKKNIESFKVVVLSPMNRQEMPENMEVDLIKLARASSTPIVVPFQGERDYKEIIDSRPFAIVLSRTDLEKIAGKEIQFIGEVTENLSKIFMDKIPFVLLTGSKKGTILYADKEIYFAHLGMGKELNIDTNKAMLGLAAGIARKYSPEMILRLAVASGNMERQEEDFASIKLEMNKLKIEKMER